MCQEQQGSSDHDAQWLLFVGPWPFLGEGSKSCPEHTQGPCRDAEHKATGEEGVKRREGKHPPNPVLLKKLQSVSEIPWRGGSRRIL